MMAGMDQFVSAQRAMLEAAHTVGLKSLDGVEKLVALNLQATRTSIEEMADHARSLMDSKDPQKVAETAMSAIRPAGEKFASYAKQLYDIGSETGGAIVDVMQKHVRESQEAASSWFESAARTAPAGSEPLFAAAKNAMSVVRASYDQAVSAGQKFAEFAEQGVAVAAKNAPARTARKAA